MPHRLGIPRPTHTTAMTTSHSVADTFALGTRLAATLRAGDVIALDGDLGAGKTHFIKGLAVGLGHTAPVTSPTFTLLHEYTDGPLPLYHFDFYRLETPEEALAIGLDEYLTSGGILAIEWASKFPHLLPPKTRWLHIHTRADEKRDIEGLE